jgi:nitrous oxidase accessory protein NosD
MPSTRPVVNGWLVLCLVASSPILAQGTVDTAIGRSATARPINSRTVIDQPGSYVVMRNISNNTTEPTIVVRASGVTLDLGGHLLLGAVSTPAGVAIEDASNVRVVNGSLRGFAAGVRVTGSDNVALSELQIGGRDTPSPTPDQREVGVLIVDSRGVDVTRNVITDGFLGVFVRGEGSGGNRIADNVITGGNNGELGICYNPAPDENTGGPHGDVVRGNLVSRWRRGLSFSSDSTGNVIRGNQIAYFDLGIEDATPPGSNVVEGNDALQIAP